MKILVAGDYYPRGDCDLSSVESIIKDVDYSIVNFESPIFKESKNPIIKCGPNQKSNEISLDPLYNAGFRCLTLANNHTLDFGEEGIMETISLAKNHGFDVVGAAKNLEEAGAILYKTINNEILAIINCCEHEYSIADHKHAGTNPLDLVRIYKSIKEAKKKSDFVIVIVHGGHEQFQLPSPRMQETYRFFIDIGADAVVNHHQHCYSGYEKYNGKPILYGLGNFYFPYENKRNLPWNEGYMVELDLNKQASPKINLYPYYQGNGNKKVELISGEDLTKFEETLERLNDIISNQEDLRKEHENWMAKTQNTYVSAFTPYTNKYLKALYRRKLLPSFLNKKKIARLINYIECEAHRERTLNALKNILNKL